MNSSVIAYYEDSYLLLAPLLGSSEANQPLHTKKGTVQNHKGEQDRGKATFKLLETGLQVKGQGQARDTVRDGAF